MEEQQVGGAEPQEANSVPAVEETQATQAASGSETDSVSYQTHRRLLAEKKKAQARLMELEERASRLEQEKLEAEGSKDQLIEKLKTQLAEKDKKYKSAIGNYAFTSVRSQIEAEASKVGCVDTEALTRLVDLDTLDVDDETFRADQEQVKMLIDEVKQKRPYLFSKHGPKLDPHVPNIGNTNPTPPNPDNLNAEELRKKIMEIDSQLKK